MKNKNAPGVNQLITIARMILIIALIIGGLLIISDIIEWSIDGKLESSRTGIGIAAILIALFLSALAKNITNINQNIEDIRKQQDQKE